MNVRDRLIKIQEDVSDEVPWWIVERIADEILAEFLVYPKFVPEHDDHRGHKCSMDPDERHAE